MLKHGTFSGEMLKYDSFQCEMLTYTIFFALLFTGYKPKNTCLKEEKAQL